MLKRGVLLLCTIFFARFMPLAAFDRGMGDLKATFIPKGTISTGFSAGYNNWTASAGDDLTKGLSLAGVITDLNGEASLFKIEAGASWFFRDNMSVGACLGYNTLGVDANHLKAVSLVELQNRHIRRSNYSCNLVGRIYMPLFGTRFLAFYTEGRLSGSVGYSKDYEQDARGKMGTYSGLSAVAFTARGGVTVFFTDKMALLVSIPIFTARIDWEHQIEKQEKESYFRHVGINRNVNVLGIDCGVTVFF